MNRGLRAIRRRDNERSRGAVIAFFPKPNLEATWPFAVKLLSAGGMPSTTDSTRATTR